MSEEQTTQPFAGGRRPARRKAPPRVSKGNFERAALRHLDRYPCSVAGLRAVLTRRAERSHAHHGGDLEESRAIVEATLVRMAELGLLDDRRYARALIRRLRGRGNSQRRISARLREKGIDESLRGELVAELAEGDSELEAARVYARRRRLGRYRRGRESVDPCETSASEGEDREARRLRRQRELGALSRAGFDFDVASRALDGE